MADYLGNPALNASLLKLIVQRSPLHAWTASRTMNPNFVPDEKEAFYLGHIAHGIVLEGTENRVVVVDADDWRTKAAKEQRDEARSAGKFPILAKRMPRVRAIAKAATDQIERS